MQKVRNTGGVPSHRCLVPDLARVHRKRLTYYVLSYELFLYAGQLLYGPDEAENWRVTAPRVC